MTLSAQRRLFFLTLILLLAAITRILHIGAQSLWIDEGATWFILKQPDMIAALGAIDHHPPLYYALLNVWRGLTGNSEVALRMFSALCSLLSVAAVVPLTRAIIRVRQRESGSASARWLSNPIIPILAAVVLALSDPEVVLAQDMRMYALRTLLAIVSMMCYVRWIIAPKPAWAAGWVSVTVALIHTQYQGLYIPLVQGLHALIFLRGRVRVSALSLLALIGVLCAPWFLAYGLNQRNNDPGVRSALPSNWETVVQLTFKFFSQQWALMIGLLLIGTVALIEHRRAIWRPFGMNFLLLAWVGVTLTVTFAANLLFPVLAPHRVLLMSPAIAILIAQGLRNIPGWTRVFLIGVIVVYGVTTTDDYYPKEPWRQVSEQMARYAQPGEYALMEVYRGDLPLGYYLDHLMPLNTPIESLRQYRDYAPEQYPAGVIAQLERHSTVWLMHWSPDLSAFGFLATTGYVRTAAMTTEHIGNRLNVYRYDRLPALQPDTIIYQNGMQLRHSTILPDMMRIDLWWSSETILNVDYTVSAFLLNDAGQLVAQHDAFPFENGRATTSWGEDEIVYDPHPVSPTDLPPGLYTAAVQVYTVFDGLRVPTNADEPWAIIGTLER